MVYVKLSLSFFLFRIKTKTQLFAKCFKNYFETFLQSSEASLLFLQKKKLQEKEMKKESDNKKRREEPQPNLGSPRSPPSTTFPLPLYGSNPTEATSTTWAMGRLQTALLFL
jgi:hypothetical protein